MAISFDTLFAVRLLSLSHFLLVPQMASGTTDDIPRREMGFSPHLPRRSTIFGPPMDKNNAVPGDAIKRYVNFTLIDD